jgi:serine/threonine protein kinase
LLRSTTYSSPIDIWAVGTIIVELYNLQPLFPGDSEIDEIFRICSVCGNPLPEGYDVPNYDNICAGGIWPEGLNLAGQIGFKFKQASPIPISSIIPMACTPAIVLVANMLLYDPHKRPTASEALESEWFNNLTSIEKEKEDMQPKSIISNEQLAKSNGNLKPVHSLSSNYIEEDTKMNFQINANAMGTREFMNDDGLISMTISKAPINVFDQPSPYYISKKMSNPNVSKCGVMNEIERKSSLHIDGDVGRKSVRMDDESVRNSTVRVENDVARKSLGRQDGEMGRKSGIRIDQKKSLVDVNPYLADSLNKTKINVLFYLYKSHIQKAAEAIPKFNNPIVFARKKSFTEPPNQNYYFTDYLTRSHKGINLLMKLFLKNHLPMQPI